MLRTIFLVVTVIILVAGCIWLQIFLSKRENKWLGFIIPTLCFMFSIITVLSLSMYTVTGTIDGTFEGIAEERVALESEKPSMISMLATGVPVFLIFNIPTVIFLAIYFACREKLKLRTELDKMNIQDLG